jgi:DNA modification methylase
MKTVILNVSIESVEPHPQILKTYVTKNLQGLKLTMEMVGHLLEPVKVVQRQDKYLIFDGISRYFAAIQLGWKIIDVEVFDLTEPEVQNQAVIRGIVTKRSLLELSNRIELFLDILGSSQGKKRETLGDLAAPDDDFGLAGKDRYEIACEIAGSDFSASSIRRLLAVKDRIENGNKELKGLGIWDKLESGEMKINQAYNLLESYGKDQSEYGSNAVTEALDFVAGNNYQLYNKTCEDLSDVVDDSIDLCIQSNPYFQQRQYPEGTKPEDVIPHGQEPAVDEYVKKQVEVFRGVRPKLKETGNLVIVMADSYSGRHLRVTHKFIDAMEDDGWIFIDEWIWKKTNQKPTSTNKRLMPTYEKILHFAKDEDKYYYREFKNWLPDGDFDVAKGRAKKTPGSKKEYGWSLKRPLERFRNFLDEQHVAKIIETNVFHWSEFKDIDPNFRHLAPFPSVIPLLPILMLSPVGSVILDVYSGTATSAAVALELGRSAISYDTDTESVKFAAKRLQLVEQNLPTENEVSEFQDEYFEAA